MTPTETITFRAIPISKANIFTGCVAVALKSMGQRWSVNLIAITADGEGIPVQVDEMMPHIPRDPTDPVQSERYKNSASYLLTGIMPEDINRIACFVEIDGEARYFAQLKESSQRERESLERGESTDA